MEKGADNKVGAAGAGQEAPNPQVQIPGLKELMSDAVDDIRGLEKAMEQFEAFKKSMELSVAAKALRAQTCERLLQADIAIVAFRIGDKVQNVVFAPDGDPGGLAAIKFGMLRWLLTGQP